MLESPAHTTVHVIFGHTSRDFVHSELTERLKSHSALQLVPSENHATTLSSKDRHSAICIVILDNDSNTGRLLEKSAESADYPNCHKLFLLLGYKLPSWVEKKLSQCALLVYPDSARERTQFWDELTMLIGLYFATWTNRGFPTRMVYLHYMSCLRNTILAGNPQNVLL